MKLTLISITINGKRLSAFVDLPANAAITEEMLSSVFPEFKNLGRGHTYSIG